MCGCVPTRQATYQRQPFSAFAQGPGARAPVFSEPSTDNWGRASARGGDERRDARRAVSPDRQPTSDTHGRRPTAGSTDGERCSGRAVERETCRFLQRHHHPAGAPVSCICLGQTDLTRITWDHSQQVRMFVFRRARRELHEIAFCDFISQ
jgi:hypothetical protein